MLTDNIERDQVGLRFWLGWVLASIAAFAVVFAAGLGAEITTPTFGSSEAVRFAVGGIGFLTFFMPQFVFPGSLSGLMKMLPTGSTPPP